MQQTPDLDPLSAFIAVFAVLVGPVLAPYAAAYSIILLGAMAGLMIGLRARHPSSRLSAIGYIVVTTSTSVFMTVYISELLSKHYPILADGKSWLLFPVSMCITAYGEYWLKMLRNLVSTVITAVIKGAK